jgi:methionine biosynthesis protein MetW
MTQSCLDESTAGLLTGAPDPLRYGGHTDAPQEVARMLADLVPMGSRVLDVGCGTGCLSRIIADTRNAEIIGIEPNSCRAAAARARGLEVYQEVFTSAIVQRLKPFDVIVFADVLEHVADPGDFLQLARRALLPGGRVIASVPNVAHWSVRLDLLRGRFDYQQTGIRDATHLRWFTAKTVRLLFESSGLRVINLQHTAGVTLPDYENRRPWRWIPRACRDPLIRALARHLPLLFGCQHIIHAIPA